MKRLINFLRKCAYPQMLVTSRWAWFGFWISDRISYKHLSRFQYQECKSGIDMRLGPGTKYSEINMMSQNLTETPWRYFDLSYSFFPFLADRESSFTKNKRQSSFTLHNHLSFMITSKIILPGFKLVFISIIHVITFTK